MRVTTGKVVFGKVVVEGEPLDEGAVVTVLAPEDSETFELSSEAEAALHAAIGVQGKLIPDPNGTHLSAKTLSVPQQPLDGRARVGERVSITVCSHAAPSPPPLSREGRGDVKCL